MKLLPKIRTNKDHKDDIDRAVLQYGAQIGGKLFGPIPEGHRREFFCLDQTTWIWHEEWIDAQGTRQLVTTRYDVRPDGVFKSQGDQPYQRLGVDELRNFYQAAKLYREQYGAELQRLMQAA